MSSAARASVSRFCRRRLAVLPTIGLLLATVVGCSTPSSTSTAQTPPEPVVTPTAGKERGHMTITVVYDNNSYDPRLRTSWGFSCLLELDQTTLLFDTGGDGQVLLSNMSTLGLDPLHIDHIVLSHIHGDHTGGLAAILATGARPVVHVPRSFPESFKGQVRSLTQLREVSQPTMIVDGVYSTGELGSGIIEQSLVVQTSKGLVVITGCAHPGIVDIVTRAKELHEGEIYLVMGGFHLGGKSRSALIRIIDSLRELGVQKVAPCHCTGDQAISMFAEEWGSDFIANGVGRVTEIAQ